MKNVGRRNNLAFAIDDSNIPTIMLNTIAFAIKLIIAIKINKAFLKFTFMFRINKEGLKILTIEGFEKPFFM